MRDLPVDRACSRRVGSGRRRVSKRSFVPLPTIRRGGGSSRKKPQCRCRQMAGEHVYDLAGAMIRGAGLPLLRRALRSAEVRAAGNGWFRCRSSRRYSVRSSRSVCKTACQPKRLTSKSANRADRDTAAGDPRETGHLAHAALGGAGDGRICCWPVGICRVGHTPSSVVYASNIR